MKILINTITPTEVAEMKEKDERFTGVYDIKGELFFPNEWKHLPDDFDVSKYPYIMDVQQYLKRFIVLSGVTAFAQGVKDSYGLYGKSYEPIVTDVLKYKIEVSPIKPIAEEIES